MILKQSTFFQKGAVVSKNTEPELHYNTHLFVSISWHVQEPTDTSQAGAIFTKVVPTILKTERSLVQNVLHVDNA